MIKNLREIWRAYKKAFDTHLGPALGDKWTRKAFGLGLGPNLDEVASEYEKLVKAWDHASGFIDQADKGSFSAINEVQAKMASCAKHAEKTSKAASKCLKKLDAYQDVVQQGLNEVLRKGSLSAALQEAFRKSFGTLNQMREFVCMTDERARNYYGRNARTWHDHYKKKLQAR